MHLNFNSIDLQLPVTEIIPSVRDFLRDKNTLIVSAPPGAGKSTVLPLALLDESWLERKKILVLEPRRLAASSIAHRMASLLNESVGQTVGYRIRFNNKVSSKTRIEVVTEGILTRMLHSDNALEDVGMIIFDEFHERSIHADIALALSRETQQILRPDLRILIMSATLNMEQLSELLLAPIVESKGQMFPVEFIYTGEQDLLQLPELCCRTINRALQEGEGDILVFLPGQSEIKKCEDILSRTCRNVQVYPLYGRLSYTEQQAAILPDSNGKRKIVLATSIAETSLTIEGIKIVIDSGFARTPVFDQRTGLSGLVTTQISMDSADQRAGRAGRLTSGTCYRMWSKATESRISSYRTPEILQADLAPLVLDMLKWGISDFYSLSWLTPPPHNALTRATDILTELKAIDGSKITTHGLKIHNLPCHPRIGNMLIMAEKSEKLALATDIAAILEERDPLDKLVGVDINLRIEALRRYRLKNTKERKWDNIEKIASSYRRLFTIDPLNDSIDPYETGLLLAYAYPERVASAKADHAGQFQLANGKVAVINSNDDISHEPWLAIAQLDSRKGTGKIFMASPLNPADLKIMSKEVEVVSWDSRKGGLIASKDLRIGSIILQSKPLLTISEEQIVNAVSVAIENEGENLLDFNDDVVQWQNRVQCLSKWNPEDGWPDVSTPSLLKNNKEWLWAYLPQVKKVEDLSKINLAQVLHQSLEYEKQIRLDELAPTSIRVPSGSLIKIKYKPNGEEPVLAVRLQELFGLMDTPKINENKIGVVIHLLSPGFKPVQVTSDLRSFWKNTYFEVRKELKRRYPKHSWPEEPLAAEAVSGVKRKM